MLLFFSHSFSSEKRVGKLVFGEKWMGTINHVFFPEKRDRGLFGKSVYIEKGQVGRGGSGVGKSV